MDLDEQELKATREKSADEMFKELGFTIVEDTNTQTIYQCTEYLLGDRCTHNIMFSKVSKIVFSYSKELHEVMGLEIKELQAINKKCKELEWLE